MDPASDGEREPADPTAADDALVSISIDNNAPPAPATPVRFFLWIIFFFSKLTTMTRACNLCNSAMFFFPLPSSHVHSPSLFWWLKKPLCIRLILLTIDIDGTFWGYFFFAWKKMSSRGWTVLRLRGCCRGSTMREPRSSAASALAVRFWGFFFSLVDFSFDVDRVVLLGFRCLSFCLI